MSGPDDQTEPSDRIDPVLRRGLHTEPLPDEALRRIRAATESEWRATTLKVYGPRYWKRYAGITAVVMSIVGVLFLTRGPTNTSGAALGTLARADYPGVVEQHHLVPDRTVASGEVLHVSQRIMVRGGARVALPGAGSLRLAVGTNVEILSAHLIKLIDGGVYLDFPPTRAAPLEFAVQTPAGTFSHIGTQFQLTVRGGTTQLRVREGQVRWRSGSTVVLSDAGAEVTIDGDGKITRDQVAIDGTNWAWAEGLAASFEIENRSLAQFLHYIARETGRSLVYSSAGLESRAATTMLHGSIGELAPVEALSTVMATTSMRFTLGSDSIRIESASDPEQPSK